MKILILANNQANIEAIKADIKNTEKYSRLEIGDLTSHEVHEISDVINFRSLGTFFNNGPMAEWKTDNPVNKVDETTYDIMIVYKRFVDGDRNHVTALIHDSSIPMGVARDTKFTGV